MREPTNLSNSRLICTGVVTLAADAALAAGDSIGGGTNPAVGVQLGDVVVCSVTTAGGALSGLVLQGSAYADNVIGLYLTNCRGIVANVPSYQVRWMAFRP
jgi:lipid-binding SYLF domain-containing protein